MQKKKFDHVVASLSPEVVVEVRDLILKPPSDKPFDALYRDLIHLRTTTFQQHFTTDQLGDRKPTQLLRRMEQLMGDHTTTADSAFLRKLFLQKPPAQVRIVVASTDDSISVAQLAQMADSELSSQS